MTMKRYGQTAMPAARGGIGGSIVNSGEACFPMDAVRAGQTPGESGLQTFPSCYGLPAYCGWQQVGGSVNVGANAPATLVIFPTITPYFEPKAIYLFGISQADPSTNARFTVNTVTVGGAPQLAIQNDTPLAAGGGGQVLLSDVFSRSDEPLLVNWSTFSTNGLAKELNLVVSNLNDFDITVFACIWGNATDVLEAVYVG